MQTLSLFFAVFGMLSIVFFVITEIIKTKKYVAEKRAKGDLPWPMH